MQRIVVFLQSGKGVDKVSAVGERGRDLAISQVFSIDGPLPRVIDDSSEYLPFRIEADLVLSFLKHPDLVHDLALLCKRLEIPLVASGKKIAVEGAAICPPT